MRNFPLDGMRVLVIEDEFLIAMDVEQLCREHGATDVVIMRSLAELGSDPFAGRSFDVAILDVMVSRGSTLEFAAKLRARTFRSCSPPALTGRKKSSTPFRTPRLSASLIPAMRSYKR